MLDNKKLEYKLDSKNFKFLNKVKSFVGFNSEFSSRVSKYSDLNFVKLASTKLKDDNKEKFSYPEDFSLEAEIESHPDHLFLKCLAIVADEPNENGDFFSEEELKNSYQTFVGCPFFCNHKNDDVEEARGKLVHAEWDDELHGIVVIGRVDSKAYPKLARGISEGYITGVSMGCKVSHSTCSICGNKAIVEKDYCDCIRNHKTRTINGKKVYEKNHGIEFIELSFVVDPACSQCHIQEIYDVGDYLKKVASLASDMEFLKHGMNKMGGMEEIEKLNQAENLLQEVSKSMLDQRQYLQLDYLADLVDVLAKLQNTKDELVDMGYAQVPSNSAAAPTNDLNNLPPEEGQLQEETNPLPIEDNSYESSPADVGQTILPQASSREKKEVYSDKIKRIAKDNLKKNWKGFNKC